MELLDNRFKVTVLSKTERPNLLTYLALHQDYSEVDVASEYEKLSALSEAELGRRVVERCIKYKHWGPLEHPAITFNVANFPHNVMVQGRTHRIACSWDVQSQRYTGKRVISLAETLMSLLQTNEKEAFKLNCFGLKGEKRQQAKEAIEELFYFRPAERHYLDREGNKYYYTKERRWRHILLAGNNVLEYYSDVKYGGFAPEHARDNLIQGIRQHFVVSFNARSLLHFCDLRLPKDAQSEIRDLAELIFEEFKLWMPEVAAIYEKKRKGKNLLAP